MSKFCHFWHGNPMCKELRLLKRPFNLILIKVFRGMTLYDSGREKNIYFFVCCCCFWPAEGYNSAKRGFCCKIRTWIVQVNQRVNHNLQLFFSCAKKRLCTLCGVKDFELYAWWTFWWSDLDQDWIIREMIPNFKDRYNEQ